MIKIHDNRTTDERMAKDIEIDGYFMHNDVLCRRVCLDDLFRYTSDGVPFVEIPCGRVSLIDRYTWVTPLRNEQIFVNVEDWG